MLKNVPPEVGLDFYLQFYSQLDTVNVDPEEKSKTIVFVRCIELIIMGKYAIDHFFHDLKMEWWVPNLKKKDYTTYFKKK